MRATVADYLPTDVPTCWGQDPSTVEQCPGQHAGRLDQGEQGLPSLVAQAAASAWHVPWPVFTQEKPM